MIRLTRSVPVASFDVQATVAVGRDRPEFLAVARLAADLARPIAPADVLRELLGPRPEVVGRRVIDRCVALGLLERVKKGDEAALSDAGRVALEHSAVLVPEEGAWRFFYVEDPLLLHGLVHAERLQPGTARKEVEEAKARPRGERLPTQRPPAPLHHSRGGLPFPSLQSGQLLRLVELGDKGATGPAGELQLTLSWEAKPSLRVTGRLPTAAPAGGARPVDASVGTPEVVARLSPDALWQALAAQASRVPESVLARWRTTAGKAVLPSAFASLTDAARLGFRRDLEVPVPELAELGRFDATVLKDVPLVPSTDADAQVWLEWLQWQTLSDYVTPASLERNSLAQVERFPHHAVRPLTPTQLLDRARAQRDEHAWYLLGPSDLGLWS